MDNPQVLGHQHGGYDSGPGQFLQKLGVTDGLVAGHGGGFLVQGRGGDAVHDAGQGQFSGLGDPFHSRLAAGNAEPADGDVLGVQVMDVHHVHRGRVLAGANRVVGFADGQGQARGLDRLVHGIGVADDHGAAGGVNLRVCQGLDHHLGANAAGVAHGNGNSRLLRINVNHSTHRSRFR